MSPNGSTLCQCGIISGKPCGRHMRPEDVTHIEFKSPMLHPRFGQTMRLEVHFTCTYDLDMPNDNRIAIVEDGS